MFFSEKSDKIIKYENNILLSFIFGKLYINNQKFFDKFFSHILLYIMFSFLGAMVIVPLNDFVVKIILYMVELIAKLFIFFVFLHVFSILLSFIFPSMVKVPLILPRNLNALFLLILLIADFYYILSLNIQLEVFKIDYNICNTFLYLVLNNTIFILYYLLSKLFIKTYNRITNSAMEYYCNNYNKINNEEAVFLLEKVSKKGKKFRLYTITLTILLFFKFLFIFLR